jgi:hypothetical protein
LFRFCHLFHLSGYVSTVAILGFVLAMVGIAIAIGFNVVFFRLNRVTNVSDRSKAKKKSQLFYALIVGTLFSLCFLAKSGIFIAFCVVTTIEFPIIVFAVLEIVPTYALIFYVFPANSRVYRVMSRSHDSSDSNASQDRSSRRRSTTNVQLSNTTSPTTTGSSPTNSTIHAGAGTDPARDT